jgi:hypothetical protein
VAWPNSLAEGGPVGRGPADPWAGNSDTGAHAPYATVRDARSFQSVTPRERIRAAREVQGGGIVGDQGAGVPRQG